MENDKNIPTPTQTDITTALLITDRILLRRAFERLINRKGAKYFKNIVIRDVPWGEITPVPKNFPPAFAAKYPFDFVAEFTTLGCNALKCYKHDYDKPCRGFPPYLINGRFGACSEACYKVYDEFNDYLCENFKIKIDNDKNNELSFETFSIEKPFSDGSGAEQSFCGMQLVDLKRFAILPSSRWDEKFDSFSSSPSPSSTFLNQKSFREIYEKHPTKVCDMAGLVDSPPLEWNAATQNVHFTPAYCQRFRKKYDPRTDSCFRQVHRKILGFVVGESIMNQVSDEEMLFPFIFLVDKLGPMALNTGYDEREITQKKLERAFYTSDADKHVKRKERVDVIQPRKQEQIRAVDALSQYKNVISHKVAKEIGAAVLATMRSLGEEALIEEGVTSSPTATLFLLKYYSKSFVQNASRLTQTTKGLFRCALRIMVIFTKAIVSEVSFQIAIKCIIALKSVANAFGSFGLLLLVPEILLSVYNVGGYNREIDRDQLTRLRQESLKAILKGMNFSRDDDDDDDDARSSFFAPLSFISVVPEDAANNDGGGGGNLNVVSPLVTPELVYNLCLVNFHSNFPKYSNEIGRTGLDPNEGVELTCEYLSLLKVNSVGQRLLYETNDDNDDYNDETSVIDTVDDIVQTDGESFSPRFSSLKPFQVLENSSEIIQKEIDVYASDYDYKSAAWKYQCVGKNYDLILLSLVAFLALVIGMLALLFSCYYCNFFHKNDRNQYLTGAVVALFTLLLVFWFSFFGKLIKDENKTFIQRKN